MKHWRTAWAIDQKHDSKRKFVVPDTFVPFNAQPRYLDRVESSVKCKDGKGKDAAAMYAEAYEGAQLNEKNGLIVFLASVPL